MEQIAFNFIKNNMNKKKESNEVDVTNLSYKIIHDYNDSTSSNSSNNESISQHISTQTAEKILFKYSKHLNLKRKKKNN